MANGMFYLFDNDMGEELNLPSCVSKLINRGFHTDIYSTWTVEGAFKADLGLDDTKFLAGQSLIGPAKRTVYVDIYEDKILIAIRKEKWIPYFAKLYKQEPPYEFTYDDNFEET
jgi:hypothetical protein